MNGDIKDIIKSRRTDLGLTLEDVARKVGVSSATISRWESGDIKNMRRDKISKLSSALQIDPAVLMGWEVYESQEEINKFIKCGMEYQYKEAREYLNHEDTYILDYVHQNQNKESFLIEIVKKTSEFDKKSLDRILMYVNKLCEIKEMETEANKNLIKRNIPDDADVKN